MKKSTNKIILLHGKKLIVKKLSYIENNRTALELAYSNGREYMIATVNLPGEHLEADEVVIRNYSEGNGVMDALIIAAVIDFPNRFVNDNLMFPVCKLCLF
jgi:hypothetical protein